MAEIVRYWWCINKQQGCRCDSCGIDIPYGEKYFGMDGSDFLLTRYCLECGNKEVMIIKDIEESGEYSLSVIREITMVIIDGSTLRGAKIA